MGGGHKQFFKKWVVAGSFFANLGILGIFKYTDFFLENVNRILSAFNLTVIDKTWDLLLPVGISFYTFQALSYTVDVYREEIPAEKNILKYALFVSFFPQLVAGPIERSKNLITQIVSMDKIKLWNFERIRDGLLLMIWGYFQKLVIADRCALFVNAVYNSYHDYGFVEIAVATVLFAFQIYCDFDGYTNIARGAAQIMGINLMRNFKQPYLASSMKGFWRRWHISLTSWFTDYLYIPLGGNRKGKLRQYVNILIVFTVSGLWHGARWSFILWGVLHGFYQIAGNLKEMLPRKDGVKRFSTRLRGTIFTFLLTDFAWLFFRSEGIGQAVDILRQMSRKLVSVPLTGIGGWQISDWYIIFLALFVLLIVDVVHEKGIDIRVWIYKQEIWFRWLIYQGALWFTIMFGIYGVQYEASQFIYFQF